MWLVTAEGSRLLGAPDATNVTPDGARAGWRRATCEAPCPFDFRAGVTYGNAGINAHGESTTHTISVFPLRPTPWEWPQTTRDGVWQAPSRALCYMYCNCYKQTCLGHLKLNTPCLLHAKQSLQFTPFQADCAEGRISLHFWLTWLQTNGVFSAW